MTQTPITVTYTLEEVLGEIKQGIKETNQKLDALHSEVSEIRQKDLPDIKVELTALKTNVENIDKRIEKLENTQKNQVWTLITLLGGSLITVGFRVFLSSNNP